jgi:hypothetical protein
MSIIERQNKVEDNPNFWLTWREFQGELRENRRRRKKVNHR